MKRRPDGRLQYVSPWRCPFNYGSVPGVPIADDGDAQDAFVLGASAAPTTRIPGVVVGIVRVTDEDVVDDKWIVAPPGYVVSHADRVAVERFFVRYARWKTVFNRLRLRPGAVVHGIDWA